MTTKYKAPLRKVGDGVISGVSQEDILYDTSSVVNNGDVDRGFQGVGRVRVEDSRPADRTELEFGEAGIIIRDLKSINRQGNRQRRKVRHEDSWDISRVRNEDSQAERRDRAEQECWN